MERSDFVARDICKNPIVLKSHRLSLQLRSPSKYEQDETQHATSKHYSSIMHCSSEISHQ